MESIDEVEKWSSFDMRGKLDGLSKLLEIAENNHEVVSDWANFILVLSGSTTSSNPKLAEGSLEVLSTVFRSQACSATSFSKLLIPAIVAGFSHIKTQVNLAAVDLVLSVSVAASQEKSLLSSFVPQLFSLLSHDLWRVRAQTLNSLLKLCEADGDSFHHEESPLTAISARESVTKLASCLDDAHATVREYAMNLTSFLVSTSPKRNKIMSALQAYGVRSTHMVTLRRMVGDMQANGAQAIDKENVPKSNVTSAARGSSIKSHASTSSSSASSVSSSSSSFSVSNSKSISSVKPLVVDSDSEMNREMCKIQKDMSNEDDWLKRMKGLERLQSLALGSSDRESFVVGLKGIADLVVAQVKDLRSSLSKEGCCTVGVLAMIMGDAFAPFADIFIMPLIALTVQAIAVIAESGMSALRDIVTCTSTGFPGFLKKLNLVSMKKKGQDRAPALTLTALAIRTWTEASGKVTKVFADLEGLLKEKLKDYDKNVRSAAREVMAELELVMPEVGKRLFARLDIPSQKEFLVLRSQRGGVASDEASTHEPAAQIVKEFSSSLKHNLSVSPVPQESSKERGATRVSETGPIVSKKPARRMSLSSGPSRVSVPMKAYGKDKQKAASSSRRMSLGSSRLGGSMDSHIITSTSIRPKRSMFGLTHETVASPSLSASPMNPLRQESVIEEMEETEVDQVEESMCDTSATDLLSAELMKEPDEQAVTSSEDSPPLPPTLCNPTSPPPPLCLSDHKLDQSAQGLFSPRSPQAPVLSSPMANSPLMTHSPHIMASPSPLKPQLFDSVVESSVWVSEPSPQLLAQVRDVAASKFSGTWSDRLKISQALSGASGLIKQFSLLTTSDQIAVRSAVHILLGDLHEKVMVSTLTVLVQEFTSYPDLMNEGLVEVALPRAAHLLFDKKESIRDLSHKLLDAIRGYPDASFVLRLCMAHLSEGLDKVRQEIIDFAIPLIPIAALQGSFHHNASKGHLLKTTVMRLAVVAVLPDISNSASKHRSNSAGGPTAARDRLHLKASAVKGLSQLCLAADPEQVVAQIRSIINLEQQHVLRPLLCASLPAIAEAWALKPPSCPQSESKQSTQKKQPSTSEPASRSTMPSPSPSVPYPSTVSASPIVLHSSAADQNTSSSSTSRVQRLLAQIDMAESAYERTVAILELTEVLKSKHLPTVCFTSVLISLLDSVTQSPIHHLDGGDVLKDDLVSVQAALSSLKVLVTHYTTFFDGCVEIVCRKLLRYALPCDMVLSVESILSVLMINMTMLKQRPHGTYAVKCVNALLPHLERQLTCKSAATILNPLVSRVPSADLLMLLSESELLPGLQFALLSECCDTRKAAVLVLADIVLCLGDVAFPILSAKLSTHHMKLVTLYANKQSEKQKSSQTMKS